MILNSGQIPRIQWVDSDINKYSAKIFKLLQSMYKTAYLSSVASRLLLHGDDVMK